MAITQDSFNVDYVTLKDIKEKAEKLMLKYGEDARVKKTNFPYDDSDYFYVYENRLENDQEYQKRIDIENKLQQIKEERDCAEFERLSKKFKQI